MREYFIQCVISAMAALSLVGPCASAADWPAFSVGAREVVAARKQLDALGLDCFCDGNLGVVKKENKILLYGANGSKPVRVTGTMTNLLQVVEPVTISTGNAQFSYLSGGPIYRDPQSGRLLLFYHAEIHRGTEKNFYSILGLAIQADAQGLEFRDLGPFFMANLSPDKAQGAVELCGAPYMVRNGDFYVYARDTLAEGSPRQSNLSVARARVHDVVQGALTGKSANWKKYYMHGFSEPALGGKSSPLETGNPGTRWMDISYNTALGKYIMAVAASTSSNKVELFMTCSDDGLTWAKRCKLADDDGESFYPSIVGFGDDSRQSGREFFIYYTFSARGGWERWSDAVIVRRKVTFINPARSTSDAGGRSQPFQISSCAVNGRDDMPVTEGFGRH